MKIFSKSFLAIILLILPILTHASTNITAVFAFGDSILDPGNNNHLVTIHHSNHHPYGQDFPGHIPTGRFSNGRLTTDFIVSELGIKEFLPAYLDPKITDQDLITGASFASAGTGYDDLTAKEGNVLSFSKQLALFEECMERVKTSFGTKKASYALQNAAFIVAGGTNDVVNNFYALPTRKLTFTISSYHDFLLRNLEGYLRSMYKMGGRKFAVVGLPPTGCLPLQVTAGSLVPSTHILHRQCVKQQNVDSQKYNAKLRALISRLEISLPGSRFGYIDAYNYLMDMIENPTNYGFEHTDEGCCGTGTLEFGPLCSPVAPTCEDPSKYLFWDAVHPSEAGYFYMARNSLAATLPLLIN